MAWGGARPGAGRKPTGAAKKPNPNKPRRLAETKLPERAVTVAAEPRQAPAFDKSAWAMMLPEIEEISRKYAVKQPRTEANNPFKLPDFPKLALPKDPKLLMAADSALSTNLAFGSDQWLSGGPFAALPGEGLLFLGFTYLSELAQRPEYRVMSETIADDATRKWIDFDVVGDEQKQKEERAKDPQGYDERMADPDERKKRVDAAGKMDKVKALKDDQLRLGVKDRFYEQFRNDGFFGRSHLFLDIRHPATAEINTDELKAPIGDSRDASSKTKCQKGWFQGLRTIEPVWTYPLMYNAINPLREDWYNPQVWYVMGQEIHGSRLQTFIGHPVPDMLKPAYSFSGLSLTQMAKPYVDIWLQTRQAVAQLIHSFSVMVLMTDLNTLLAPGNAAGLLARVAMFNMLRDNQGTFVVNKNTEDFKNVSASLSGLHELQAQSQEHMACLPAGTLIETDRGQVSIEKVTRNDRVMTRNGMAPIEWVGVTGEVSELIEIETGASVLRATGWHPIWSETTGEFVDASNVDLSHRLLESREWENTACPSLGAGIGGPREKMDIIFPATAASCIAAFMRLTSDLFRKGVTSIIEMMTRPITRLKISNLLAQPITSSGSLSALRFPALSAGRLSTQCGRSERSIARMLAKCTGTRSIRDGFHTENTQSNASAAERILRANVKTERDSVQSLARAVRIMRVSEIKVPLQPVYNIEVDGPHEFFANGILVHNSVHRIPLVKFTGIQPSGLNASSEGEIKTYDDTIGALQSRFADPNLRRVINFQQLSLFGEIDPEITHRWEQLREMTMAEKGQKEKDDADRNQKYVDMGAISPGEIRKVIIEDPDLPYTALNPEDVPDLASEEETGLEPQGGRPDPKADGEEGNESPEDRGNEE